MSREIEYSTTQSNGSIKQFYNAFIFNIEIENDNNQSERSTLSSFPPPNNNKKSTRLSSFTRDNKIDDTQKTGCCGCFGFGKRNDDKGSARSSSSSRRKK